MFRKISPIPSVFKRLQTCKKAGPVFTNHSQEQSLSFSPRFEKLECNTTSDRLNCMI